MIAIIDYGAGNLGSVHKAFRHIGADVEVTASPDVIARADKLVLPGVGAFAHCMSGLAGVRLTQAVKDFTASGRPFLGICVGLQMLFDESEEMGATLGLGLVPGRIVRFRFDGRRVIDEGAIQNPKSELRTPNSEIRSLKVPHIGWNELRFRQDAALYQGLNQGERVYFVHSFYPEPADARDSSATSDYGYEFCCAVEKGNIHATQFHPEKSGAVGLHILRNFVAMPS